MFLFLVQLRQTGAERSSNESSVDARADNSEKAYWMQRAAELSVEMHQSNSYWNEHTSKLQSQLQSQPQSTEGSVHSRRTQSAATTPIPASFALPVSTTREFSLAQSPSRSLSAAHMTPSSSATTRMSDQESTHSLRRPDSGYPQSMSMNG